MKTKMTPQELLSDIELWIPVLEKQNQPVLHKQAIVTKMKLELLIMAEKDKGALSEVLKFILGICVRDYEYIQSKLKIVQCEKPTEYLH